LPPAGGVVDLRGRDGGDDLVGVLDVVFVVDLPEGGSLEAELQASRGFQRDDAGLAHRLHEARVIEAAGDPWRANVITGRRISPL